MSVAMLRGLASAPTPSMSTVPTTPHAPRPPLPLRGCHPGERRAVRSVASHAGRRGGSNSDGGASAGVRVSTAAERVLRPGEKLEDDTSIFDTEDLALQDAKRAALADTEGKWVPAWWRDLPARYQVVVATSLAFVICNMDKVNMSVAIIPMAREFGWSPSVAGIVQSSFFWGYILCQLPGGYLSSRLGGRSILPAGVGLWSVATAAVPALAGTIPTLCLSRAAVGLGEGVAPSAATDMVARVVPPGERSRAVAFIFGGLHVGSIAGLLAGPALIKAFGWPAVFVAFGGVGVVWAGWWEALVRGIAVREPEVAAALAAGGKPLHAVPSPTADAASDVASTSAVEKDADAVPWRAFLRAQPVRALMYTHFCHNWFHYSVLAWLPSYFTDTLSVDLAAAAQISLLPPVAGIVVSSVAGPAADGLIGSGVRTATVRKSLQAAAFLGPVAFLTAAGAASAEGNAPLTVGLITAALGVTSFSLGGLYSNHQDLSPKYASILLGLTNTAGAIPGIIGVAATGFLLDQTGSWDLALFAPSMAFFVTGAAVYTKWGSSDQVDFDSMDDSPLQIERSFRTVMAPVRNMFKRD